MSALFRIDELRRIEHDEVARLPPGTLMQRAGRAAARAIDRERPGSHRSFVVLCGPGDNGGDGFVCAAELERLGHRCVCWAPAATSRPDAAAARAAWVAAGGAIAAHLPANPGCDAVIDALFGIGLTRALADPYLTALRWAEALEVPVHALDVPSGLDADTGAWVGGVAGAHAHGTITFLGDKPGLHTLDGVDAAGVVRVEGLGVAAPASPGRLVEPAEFAGALHRRARNTHKGSFGSVAVIGGAAGMVGAALLAARAALRLGAGRVYVDCIGAPEWRVDPLQPELMFRPQSQVPAVDALVVGCGLGAGDAALAALERALDAGPPVVLDADALNCIANMPQAAARLSARGAQAVVTPHPLEAARLLGADDVESVQRDRIAAARAIAARLRAVVVLKGAGSVIADPSGRYWINPTGGPALATAGTGDVLAGMIGALIAQGIEAGEAARAAVWLHGRSADIHGGDLGLVASEVASAAARELARLRGGPV